MPIFNAAFYVVALYDDDDVHCRWNMDTGGEVLVNH
jgi:hypothetical protein